MSGEMRCSCQLVDLGRAAPRHGGIAAADSSSLRTSRRAHDGLVGAGSGGAREHDFLVRWRTSSSKSPSGPCRRFEAAP